jgi:ribonuclease HII
VKNYAFDRRQLLPPDTASSLPGLIVEAPPAAFVAGVDEAGRGPLAGPVVAAAVILKDAPRIRGLRDSKQLTPLQRDHFFDEIQARALAVTVSIVPHDVIDTINILAASLHAMRDCLSRLSVKPDLVLVDGNQKPNSGLPERAIVKGDGLSAAIMAASIVAKVTRDRLMIAAHERFPEYGFNEHKGYACERHIEALRKHGPCPIHRRTFDPLKSWLTAGAQLLPS